MILLLATAFALGSAHAVAPDHLAAVGVFVSRARSPREAITHGAHWGLGHALTLTVAGLAVLYASTEWPQVVSLRAEWLVGVLLVLLGLRSLWRATQPTAITFPPQPSEPDDAIRRMAGASAHPHRHPLFGIGMLHGLAGSGAMAAMVPLGHGQQPTQAAVWLVLFGAGTIAAMALIAGAAGWTLQYSVRQSTRAVRAVMTGAGLMSVAVGIAWLLQVSR